MSFESHLKKYLSLHSNSPSIIDVRSMYIFGQPYAKYILEGCCGKENSEFGGFNERFILVNAALIEQTKTVGCEKCGALNRKK